MMSSFRSLSWARQAAITVLAVVAIAWIAGTVVSVPESEPTAAEVVTETITETVTEKVTETVTEESADAADVAAERSRLNRVKSNLNERKAELAEREKKLDRREEAVKALNEELKALQAEVMQQPADNPEPDSDCHPSYVGACVPVGVSDVDCAGGSGDGPEYTGTVEVVGPDEYGLDDDGDGVGCQSS
jgi:resuscitation-promoting factor RpfB